METDLDTHTDLVASIARSVDARWPDRRVRVAVDGITSSGKSTFADELAAAIRSAGRPALRVSMDGYHHQREHRHRQGALSGDGYYEDAYDLAAAARDLLAPLGPGGTGRYRPRIVDLAADGRVDEVASAPADAIAVVDGSFLQRPELDGRWDVVIYLHVDFPVAESRGIARDADALGGVEAARRAFRERYHAAGRRYQREIDPQRRATIVVDNNDLQRPRLVRGLEDPGAAR